MGWGKSMGKEWGLEKIYGDGAGMDAVYLTKSVTSLW